MNAGIQKPKEYETKLVKAEELFPTVKLFTFELEEIFNFRPGQFVMLQGKDKDGNLVKRSYSIVSDSGKKKVELVMNIIPHGKLTPIIDQMKVGEKTILQGPYGKFGEDSEKSKENLFFIATGTGIAPIKCIISSLLKNESDKKDKGDKKTTLLYGFRHEENYLFRKDLEFMEKKHKNLILIPSISRPHDPKGCREQGWKVGRVTDYLNSNLEDRNQEFYICGLTQMVRDTKKLLIEKGVDEKRIHIEPW